MTTAPNTTTPGDLRLRVALGALGFLVGVYGLYLLLKLGWDNLLATFYWLAAGVILHDGVIGIALIVLGAVVVVVVPGRVRGPVAAGLVVLGTVTMTAVPVLGRFGEASYKPTLLDRNYTVGWLVFAAIVVVGTGLGVVRALRAGGGTGSGLDGDTTREPHDEVGSGDDL